MLKIRLMRIGTKKRPFYRVVAVDERSKRTGGYVELLGTYNPLTNPKDINLKQDRIDHWVKQGAQMSIGFLRIIGKAPQRKMRKPKKSTQKEAEGNPKTPQAEIKVTQDAQEPAEKLADSAKTTQATAESKSKNENTSLADSNNETNTIEQTQPEVKSGDEAKTKEKNEEEVGESVQKSKPVSDAHDSTQNKS
jgi:small subunit ribosomal protein S16